MILEPHHWPEFDAGYEAAAKHEPFDPRQTRPWQAGYNAWVSDQFGADE